MIHTTFYSYIFTDDIQYGSFYIVNNANKIVTISMNQRQISEPLKSVITRTVSTLIHNDIKSSYTDRLVIELLGDESSSAHSVIRFLAGEHGIAGIMRSVVNSLLSMPYLQIGSPDVHFDKMCYTLLSMLGHERLTSAHILYAAAFDSTTATSKALFHYGISERDILREIERKEYSDEVLLSVC